MTETKNIRQPLSKREIATLYCPNLKSHQACNRLRAWIKKCKELENELIKTGYHPSQRILTPKQRDLIFKYLGDPRLNEPPLQSLV